MSIMRGLHARRHPIGIICSVVALVAIIALVVVTAHVSHERDRWRHAFFVTHADFQRHMHCMTTGACDAMRVVPPRVPPDQE